MAEIIEQSRIPKRTLVDLRYRQSDLEPSDPINITAIRLQKLYMAASGQDIV